MAGTRASESTAALPEWGGGGEKEVEREGGGKGKRLDGLC